MIFCFLLCSVKCYCTQWLDEYQGKVQFYYNSNCNGYLYSNTNLDDKYKYIEIAGMPNIPDNWISSGNNLRIVESSDVQSIGINAFIKAPNLESIIFTKSGNDGKIMSSAFRNLKNLRRIHIGSVFDNLNEYCFADCSNLEYIIFSYKSSWYSLYIYLNAFANCNQIKTIEYGRSISSSPGWSGTDLRLLIQDSSNRPYQSTFKYFLSLNIEFKSYYSINNKEFYSWTNLKSVTFSDYSGTSSIGLSAFENCSSLTTLIIGRQLQITEFPGWINLETVTFSDSSNSFSIHPKLFENCQSIKQLTIGRQLFTQESPGWTNLESLTFTNSQNSFLINTSLFSNCKSLTTMTIGRQLNTIEFPGWTNLEKVIFTDSSNEFMINTSLFMLENCSLLTKLTIGRPISSSNLAGWGNINNIVITNNNFVCQYSVFSECHSFINLEFTPEVSVISSSAFNNWIILESITFPSTLSILKNNCFAGCTNLVSITFLNSPINIRIESDAFANCPILELLTLGREISPLSDFPKWTKLNRIVITTDDFGLPLIAFNDCESFPNLEFAASVSTIKRMTVNQLYKLRMVTLHESEDPIVIDQGVFQVCKSLETVRIGRMITSGVFPGWTKLKNLIITSNYFAAPFTAFVYCEMYPTISFEKTVTTLNFYAFSRWDVFTSFIIPPSLTTLKMGCFAECANLVSVTFSDTSNPITIEGDAFANCESLKTISIGRPIDSANYPGWNDVDKILITSEKFSAPHQNFDDSHNELNIEFSPSISNLKTDLFVSWRQLKSITIPQSIRSISTNCFTDCYNLESIAFENTPSQISMGPNSFNKCDKLKTVTIGRPISSNEFPGWTNAEEIIITSNYFAAPFSIFSDCESFPDIHFDKFVSTIRSNTFKSWTDLTFLTNSSTMENIVKIGSSSFRGINLNQLNLIHCTSLQSIGEYAFAEMPNLVKVTLPPMTSIGVGCFKGCPALTEISLPMYITEISESSFEDCISLISAPIPPSVASIGQRSFAGTGIEWVRIGNMVTVHPHAFANCKSLHTVELWDYAVVSEYTFRNSCKIGNVVMYEFVSLEEKAFSCTPKFSYFGQSNFSVAMTAKTLNKIGIDSIDVIESYLENNYCGISVNRVQVNNPSCNVEEKCSSAPFYDDYFRKAVAIKKSQIKMFCLLHQQQKG